MTERDGNQRWRVRVEPSSMRSVREEIAAFAETRGFCAEKVRDLSIVVAEALFNAMDHGGCGAEITVCCDYCDADQQIEVAVEDEGEDPETRCVELTRYLSDCGEAFPEVDLERGRGLFLIRQKSDEVRIERVADRGVRVVMVLRR